MPQHHSVPSVLIPQVWNEPAETLAQLVSVPMRIGLELDVTEPSPNCP